MSVRKTVERDLRWTSDGSGFACPRSVTNDMKWLPPVPYLRPKVGRRSDDRKILDEWYAALKSGADVQMPPERERPGTRPQQEG